MNKSNSQAATITVNCSKPPAETPMNGIRLYVGGLGEAVTDDDLRKTFSNLGRVESAEILRTKGRSFAYIQFHPSSDKSLPKIFSTYNGCLWKGGRLRLEKAKEHYLDRLKREWEEDAEAVNEDHTVASEDVVTLKKVERAAADEKMQIRIFFPRLRKVKALPFKGTGKHKYSFRRFESASLPLHFCDCPEHSDHFQIVKEKQVVESDIRNDGLKEEEISMMQSIMNKLFERESDPKVACNGLQASPEGYVETLDDLPVDEGELDNVTDDDDDLVLNVVSQPNHRASLRRSGKQHVGLIDEVKRSNKPLISEDKPDDEGVGFPTAKSSLPNKKMKLADTRRNEKELVSSMHKQKREPKILSERSEEQKKFFITKHESITKQSTAKGSGLRKSKWMGADNSFSLSQIIESGSSKNEELENVPQASSQGGVVDSLYDPQVDESEHDDSTDDDNLVFNMVSQQNNGTSSMRKIEQRSGSADEVKRLDKPEMSEQKLAQEELGVLNDYPVRTNKKRKSVEGQRDEKALVSPTQERKRKVKNQSEGKIKSLTTKEESGAEQFTANSFSQLQPAGEISNDNEQSISLCDEEKSLTAEVEQGDLEAKPSQEEEKNIVSEAELTRPDPGADKYARGSAWLQKSSWTQLVKEASMFSISQILPATSLEKVDLQKTDAPSSSNPTDKADHQVLTSEEDRLPTAQFSDVVFSNKEKQSSQLGVGKHDQEHKQQEKVSSDDELATSTSGKKSNFEPVQTSKSIPGVGESLPFMRNAASLKGWMRAKAALSGSLKKKNKQATGDR